jgi:hypothetical protein
VGATESGAEAAIDGEALDGAAAAGAGDAAATGGGGAVTLGAAGGGGGDAEATAGGREDAAGGFAAASSEEGAALRVAEGFAVFAARSGGGGGAGFAPADEASAFEGVWPARAAGSLDGVFARPSLASLLVCARDVLAGGVLGAGLSTAAGGGAVGIGSAAVAALRDGAAGDSVARFGEDALSCAVPVSSAEPLPPFAFRDLDRGGVRTTWPSEPCAGAVSSVRLRACDPRFPFGGVRTTVSAGDGALPMP